MNETKTASDASPEMPVPRPCSSAWNASLTPELALLLACWALSLLAPRSLSADWSLSAACASLSVSPEDWLETADDHHQQRRARHGDADEHERRSREPRDAVAREEADDRRQHRGEHRRDDDRDEDGARQVGDPDRADQDDRDAGKQPGGEAEVAEPRWRGKHAGELDAFEHLRRVVGGFACATHWLVRIFIGRGTGHIVRCG